MMDPKHPANDNPDLTPALDRAREVPHGTAAVRLMKKVDVDTATGCWIWTGSTTPGGYGSIGLGSLTDGTRRLHPAHRVAYEIFVGPIERGYQLDHLCRVRACVNPNHLQPVTQAENIRRGEGGAFWAAKTHCPSGHPYSPENTRIYRGRRLCRECALNSQRARYWRDKGAVR
ncbi:HNH endonuclease signature motif containing protein [Brevundimonas olei]|uniref:HNH endonuclease signature motif containing protein n=1 Tax=Brevundimonas olei TaxID=657642 RepID=UPI0031D129A7